ncbi:MAG: hypothetical protein ACHQ7M_09105 [Chloroflexota bacterium]
MSAFNQRRYIVTGDGITVHAQSLDEAIAAFRARARGDTEDDYQPIRIEEPVAASENGRLAGT